MAVTAPVQPRTLSPALAAREAALEKKVTDFARLYANNPTPKNKRLRDAAYDEQQTFLDAVHPERVQERSDEAARDTLHAHIDTAEDLGPVSDYREFCCEFDGEDEELASQYHTAAVAAVCKALACDEDYAEYIVQRVFSRPL
jgi:hypothetical protein